MEEEDRMKKMTRHRYAYSKLAFHGKRKILTLYGGLQTRRSADPFLS